MEKLHLELENCYGIRKLSCKMDFSEGNAKLIYASNGIMKTSFSKTFIDLSNEEKSRDLMFPKRTTVRKIVDENESDILGEQVFVIEPYREEFNSTKISTLLVNNELKKEYDAIHLDLNNKKEFLLRKLQEHSGFKGNIEEEIINASCTKDDNFFVCLEHLNNYAPNDDELNYASFKYSTIFNDKVLSFLEDSSVRQMMGEYIEKYNELTESSLYFKKGIFTHTNAENVSNNLKKDGFFTAEHRVLLKKNDANNEDDHKLITNEKDFKLIIDGEKEKILNNSDLKKRFQLIDKQITKNTDLRDFRNYLESNQHIIPELLDLTKLKMKLWCSYLKKEDELCNKLLVIYQSGKDKVEAITKKAKEEKTDWEEVIQIFNNRFFVPVKLYIKNQDDVILKNSIPTVAFIFEDGDEKNETNYSELLSVLSNGEKKALYILNIIFEIQGRKRNGRDNILIFDDIADSFDYKNKYAIIEYLMDISNEENLYSIIMTHNFDFFRTIQSRFIKRANCYMTIKTNDEIKLVYPEYLKSPFTTFKDKFTFDEIYLVASIPFIRNLIEYTKGDKDPDYLYLTSLLHIKNNSRQITIDDLAGVYKKIFPEKIFEFDNGNKTVLDVIFEQADSFMSCAQGINFEKKLVLSIAIRLKAEIYMIEKINNDSLITAINSNQTGKLFNLFKNNCTELHESLDILSRVKLMTPENIHLNSFMYEPLIDISDNHLRKLYSDIKLNLR